MITHCIVQFPKKQEYIKDIMNELSKNFKCKHLKTYKEMYLSELRGAEVDFLEKTYTPLKGIEWMVASSAAVDTMTAAEASEYIDAYGRALNAHKLGKEFGL